jgi:hypothetical protein
MSFVINFRGVDDAPDGDGYCPVFDVLCDGQRVLRYSKGLTFEKRKILENRPDVDQDLLSARRNNALLCLNVRQLEGEIAGGSLNATPGSERRDEYLPEDDLDDLVWIMRVKSCEYQESDDRKDVWCHAAAPSDPTAVTAEGRRRIAPTTPPLCLSCSLPDRDFVCSHLSHPEVVGLESDQESVVDRRLVAALCNKGRDEVANPSLCRPGSNGCWERVAEVSVQRELLPLADRALHYALDHLDVAWRAAFSTKVRLFQPKSAETLAGLVEGCASRAELGQRLNELDTVLHWLVIPDDPDVTQSPDARSLGRLRSFLDVKLAQLRVSNDDVVVVRAAIQQLRRVNDVRAALEHPGDARKAAAGAFRTVGLSYPPADWLAAWRRVQAIAITALHDIADVLARLP